MIDSYELKKSNNEIIPDRDLFSLWVSGERAEKENEIRKQYTNVKPENYENYYDFSDVTINPEPPVCAQELYAIFDSCIQEIFSNENADIDKLVTDAAKDFQTNHLDKLDS